MMIVYFIEVYAVHVEILWMVTVADGHAVSKSLVA